jgi:hypothetical protein
VSFSFHPYSSLFRPYSSHSFSFVLFFFFLARTTFYATSTQITLYPYYFTGPQVEEEFW